MSTDLVIAGSSLPLPALNGPALPFSPADALALRLAVAALERSSLIARLSSMVGKPIEMVGTLVPAAARDLVSDAVGAALRAALRVALTTLPRTAGAMKPSGRGRSGRWHTALAAASGAAGGALGLISLPVELPLSTTLILRSIADIARREGEDLSDPAVGLECLQVFALGSRTEADDLASSGYFAVRGALAKSISEAARAAAGRGLTDRSAPAIVRLVTQIAARFGIVVSQKVAAGAIPVIGAVGGAAVNMAFIRHFQAIASAHFTVRRLERTYGADAIRSAYEEIRQIQA